MEISTASLRIPGLIRVQVEPDTIGEIQAVIDGIPAKKSPGANPQVVQAAVDDSVVNVGGSTSVRCWPIVIELPPGTIRSLNAFNLVTLIASSLRRVGGGIIQALCRKDRLDG